MTPRRATQAPADRLAASITEAQLQDWTYKLCKTLRIRFYHTKDSRGSAKGFPDLVLLGPSGLLFRELKTSKGRITAEQQEWLDDLTAIGHDAAVWRPIDWVTGRIQAELKTIAKRRPNRAAPTTWSTRNHDRPREPAPGATGPEPVPRRPAPAGL
jgi:hypothetical protein